MSRARESMIVGRKEREIGRHHVRDPGLQLKSLFSQRSLF